MQQATERAGTVRPVNRRPTRKLPFPLNLYQTAVGKKWVMALTGIALLGYVLAHMVGNLKLYYGVESINHYGEWLRELAVPALARTQALWLLRIGLIVAFVLHIHSAYALTMMNRRARPVGYQSDRDYIAADFASRTMRWSGIIVGLFVVWHLADITWGWVNPDHVLGDPYHNVVESFSVLPIALFYVVANLLLGVHIYHGAWSIFQSLGANNPRLNGVRRPFATAFAAIIVIGNVSFPIAVQLGIVDEDNRTTPLADEVEDDQPEVEGDTVEAAPADLVITISEAAR